MVYTEEYSTSVVKMVMESLFMPGTYVLYPVKECKSLLFYVILIFDHFFFISFQYKATRPVTVMPAVHIRIFII